MKEKMRFSDLDEGVKKKYLLSLLGSLTLTVFFVVCAIMTHITKEFLVFSGAVFLYAAYTFTDLMLLLKSGKFFSFTGNCVQVNKPVYDAKVQKFYGEGKIVIEKDGMQCIVPINHLFEVTDNDTLTVICKESDMIHSGNFYEVLKPLTLRIEKYG